LRERRERAAEKVRMEEARAKMSAKRLQRLKKVSKGVTLSIDVFRCFIADALC